MKTILPTEPDIYYSGQTFDLPGGITAKVETERDENMGPPWEEHDEHGPVSDWTTRDKRAGERVLCTDGRSHRYYDFAKAVKIAKRDGWDAPPYKTGTKGQQAARAAEADFEWLRAWCDYEWQWIGVIVTLTDESGAKIASDSVWGIKDAETDDGKGRKRPYWAECAAEMIETLYEQHCHEAQERAYWEARDTVTVP